MPPLDVPAFLAEGFAAPVRRADFNGFDGSLCDPAETELPACPIFVFLLVLLAAGPPDCAGDPSGFGRNEAGADFPDGDFGDFLRVFLDIRLPFVAFRGSIIEVLRQTGIRSTAGQIPINRQYAQR